MSQDRSILMVDDDPNDRFLLRRAFSRAGVLNPIFELTSGEDAIAYLSGIGKFEDRTRHPFPAILLLDLNMPRISGFDVLDWIRRKLTARGLLIIVLSRLEQLKDINRAYSLGANSFLTKPGNEKELHGLIESFRDYWLLRSRLPSVERADENPGA